jgi:membrane protease YdiL (CAAX protease family)
MNSAESNKNLTDYPLLTGILITVIFSIVLSINVIFSVDTVLINAGFSDFLAYFADFSIRFLSGTIIVISIAFLMKSVSKRHISVKEYIKTDVWFSKGFSTQRTFIAGIISPLCYFMICIVVASGLGAFKLDFDIIFQNPDAITGVGWLIFLYALIPGIWEEIIFRGVILNSVKSKYSANITILVSSILFGFFHVITSIIANQPLEMLIFYFMMSTLFGLTWGYMVVKCESIIPGILAHYIIDAFGYAIITHPMNSGESIAGPFFMTTTFLYPLVSFLLAKYFLKKP